MRSWPALLLALAACDALGAGGGGGGSATKMTESGTKHGSAGGFSAQLSSELGKQGVEAASIGNPGPAPKTAPATGSAGSEAQAPATGSATKVAVADVPAPANDTKAAPADTKAAPADTKAAPADTKPAPADTKPAPADTKLGDTKLATPATGQAVATQTAAAPATKGIANRVPVKPSGEQAQIKFDLEPNWERDVGEAGTFSLVVKVPNTEEQRVFYARYSFEDQAAPNDCDSYRKFLEDKKILTVTLNRQRGAACYIEGTDGSGVANYRYLVTYSGKRLLCTGSLYKDQAALGDLRDKVLMQAKKICETLAL
ncbi:MAG TPA: hypothetical protein VL326_13140 [Kofleriaceae bacterium]|nr:hypothetical protein [Kofleriaceae bacterium]